MVLFVVAMLWVSATLAWAVWPIGRVLAADARRDFGAIGIGVSGIAAAIGFMGVALNQWDLRFGLQGAFVKFIFGSLLVFMALVGFEEIRDDWPWWDVAVCAVYALALGGYFLNLQYGPKLDSSQGVMIQPVLQKAMVYLSVLCLSLIAWAVRTQALVQERVSS
jgi:hypothetical protein